MKLTTNRASGQDGADHFGGCPECHHNDGYYNVGKGHWFYCITHRCCWFAGSNLFSSWKYQTDDEQRAAHAKYAGTVVEPWLPDSQ